MINKITIISFTFFCCTSGADYEILDKNNRSPADIAKFQKSIKCYEILRSRQKEEKKRKNKSEYLGGDREENNLRSYMNVDDKDDDSREEVNEENEEDQEEEGDEGKEEEGERGGEGEGEGEGEQGEEWVEEKDDEKHIN